MRTSNLKSELIQLIEEERDESILKAIKTLLQKTGLDATLKEKLTNRALQSEKEILSGKLLSKADIIRQTDKVF
ncbi:MAG TPA: hypothetical protein VK809_05525 [Bacteroidia bacterium]|jgi:hypothetical protein|nr:hypothetical protein [Bacteroidia bacterium]